MNRVMQPRKAARYVDDLVKGLLTKRITPVLGPELNALTSPGVDWSTSEQETVTILGDEMHPLVPGALQEAEVLCWRPEPFRLVQEAARVYEGVTLAEEDVHGFGNPRLWILPPDDTPFSTAALFFPCLDSREVPSVAVTWIVDHPHRPYCPSRVVTLDIFCAGSKLRTYDGDAGKSIGCIMLAAAAFLKTKVARVDRQELHGKKARKAKKAKASASKVSVVHLRTFEDLQASTRRIDGRKPPRAHWVGLPGGFPRKYASGDVVWIEPYARGAGGVTTAPTRREVISVSR